MDHDERKSDVWSVGVLIYRMISGEFPFDNSFNDMLELTRSICYDNFDPPKCSEDLLSLLNQMLHKNSIFRISMSEAIEHPFFKTVKIQKNLAC